MSAERDKYVAEQEAKLKAMLEMVEVRPKTRYRRNHRKIGEIVCDTGVRTGYHNATARFVLRLNSSTGEFIVEHGDQEYVSKYRDALKAKMDQVAKITLDLKWKRYLLIKYKATVKSDRQWVGGEMNIDLSDQRKKERPVLGINLDWMVVEYSDAIELPGQGQRFMKRDVDVDGKASSTQETVHELPDRLVEYTKERKDVLLRLRAALGDVDARMVELFRGDPERVALMLDSAGAGVLMLAGGVQRAPKKSKR